MSAVARERAATSLYSNLVGFSGMTDKTHAMFEKVKRHIITEPSSFCSPLFILFFLLVGFDCLSASRCCSSSRRARSIIIIESLGAQFEKWTKLEGITNTKKKKMWKRQEKNGRNYRGPCWRWHFSLNTLFFPQYFFLQVTYRTPSSSHCFEIIRFLNKCFELSYL